MRNPSYPQPRFTVGERVWSSKEFNGRGSMVTVLHHDRTVNVYEVLPDGLPGAETETRFAHELESWETMIAKEQDGFDAERHQEFEVLEKVGRRLLLYWTACFLTGSGMIAATLLYVASKRR